MVQDPQKWIDYYHYKSTLGNRSIQRGTGGTLRPSRHGRGGYTIVPYVAPVVVTPTEQVIQQAKSEVKRLQQTYKRKSSTKHHSELQLHENK